MASAAAHLLIDRGPDAVTPQAVAEAAGVAEGLVDECFPSASLLYAEAVRAAEEIRGTSALELARALPQRQRSDSATAFALIEVFYAPDLRADVVTTRLEPMLAAQRDPELRVIMLASRSRLLTALRIVLERSGYERVAAGPDIELVAQTIDASLIRSGLSGERDPIVVAALSVARLLELAKHAS